jgi:hypothetical protein
MKKCANDIFLIMTRPVSERCRLQTIGETIDGQSPSFSVKQPQMGKRARYYELRAA